MLPSGPYPNPLGPDSHSESSKPIVAHVAGLGGGAGSAVPLKYFHVSPTTIGRGGSVEAEHTPVPGLHVCPTGHDTAVPPHVPPPHTSPVVHRLPSLHDAVLLEWTHPVPVLHESFVHGLESSQFGAAPPTHAPPAHVSVVVQAFPSLHATVLFA